MTTWHEYVQQTGKVPEWPYPIRYNETIEIDTDVLIIGGGIAGCHAAINAVRQGARVTVVEKGPTKRSGMGGAGVDHWLCMCTNPCSKVTPEQLTQAWYDHNGGWTSAIVRYITCRDGWDTLLDCERMGVQIRDVNDEFKGADFRDDATKLLFAYDYVNRHNLRVWGHDMKPKLYQELLRLKVNVLDRVQITSLINEGGRQGARVIGATGVNNRTGAFYVFRAGATVLGTAHPTRNWNFNLEVTGAGDILEINNCGDGHAAAWRAGAEMVAMERTAPILSGMGYVPYGVGNAHNTWQGTSIVDRQGREVPWVDMSDRQLSTVQQRFVPGLEEPFIFGHGMGVENMNRERSPSLTRDLPARLAAGEFSLPLYADLTRLPELERRAIFGLMVGNEGKTRAGVYKKMTAAGFDPDKDMLQVPVFPNEAYVHSCFWLGQAVPQTMRTTAGGGLLVGWDLQTSVEGLYAAGTTLYGYGSHTAAATTGRYAGRNAAIYALKAAKPRLLDPKIVATERARVYAPLHQPRRIGWKELNAAISRVMIDYCGMNKTESIMQAGLRILGDLRTSEATGTFASNPHELMRALECQSILDTSEIILHASLVRKSSSGSGMFFFRPDYPTSTPDWDKLSPIRLENGELRARELPLDYHRKAPFGDDFEHNYRQHCGVES
jgi:succinate dehydrogenase/fumarate reductase flavoprotein subunit